VVPDGVGVKNYAFDITPHDLVSAFVTDTAILHPPLDWKELGRAFGPAGTV